VGLIPASDFLHWGRILRRVRAFRPDAIFVGDLFGIPLGVMNRLEMLGAPAVYYWNEYHEDLYRPHLPFRWLRRLVQRGMLACFDEVWSNCLYNANRARALGKRVRYLFNGYHDEERPTAVRLDEGPFKAAYMGDQYGARKNLDLVLEAVRGEPCVLYMIGRINPALQARAPGNVRFVGPVPALEIYGVLRQADLLVNGSDEDGNVKTSDYLRAARPILAYRGARGCQENVLVHRFNAYLARDLKAGLRELMRDAALRDTLARNAANYPLLSWRQNTALRLEYLRESVEDYRRRHGPTPEPAAAP
jgi:glycosyltransferase involved in cell wall biosynthesis